MILGIVGPTGSGKSALGVEVAKKIKGSILSCDSVQVYKGFNIGSGKIKESEKDGVPHYLLDIREGNEEFGLGDFLSLVDELILEIERQGRIPILVGGTGLYYRGFAYRYCLGEKDVALEGSIRNQLQERLSQEGVESMYSQLLNLDPEGARAINPKHTSRIIRALTVALAHPEEIGQKKPKSLGLREDLFGVCLEVERPLLYNRISQRVDSMIQSGLVEEVRGLLAAGVLETAAPMKTIGYKEVVQYLSGELDYTLMVEKIKQASRNYAKRQMTWFRSHPELNSLPMNNTENFDAAIEYFAKLF